MIRDCLPRELIRVTAPVVPKQTSSPSGPVRHGPAPPSPASATRRSPEPGEGQLPRIVQPLGDHRRSRPARRGRPPASADGAATSVSPITAAEASAAILKLPRTWLLHWVISPEDGDCQLSGHIVLQGSTGSVREGVVRYLFGR